jgi:hypothetical protein
VAIRPFLVVVGLLMGAPLLAAELTPVGQQILKHIDLRREAAIDLLARSVNVASATENHAGVKEVGELYAAELASLGFDTTWVDQKQVGRVGHLLAERRGTRGTRVLLIGHLDTVLQGVPFRRDGRRGHDSGSSDMNGAHHRQPRRPQSRARQPPRWHRHHVRGDRQHRCPQRRAREQLVWIATVLPVQSLRSLDWGEHLGQQPRDVQRNQCVRAVRRHPLKALSRSLGS